MKKRKSKTKENLLDEDELVAFLKAVNTFNEQLLAYGLGFTGMRVSEFIHMRRDWIDWGRELILIPERQRCGCGERMCRLPRYNRKGQIIKQAGYWMPKTKNSVRAIPIVPELAPLLKKFFSKHSCIMEMIPSRGMAYYMVRDIGIRAGIKHRVFPHAIRGTFATLLASGSRPWRHFGGLRNFTTAEMERFIKEQKDRIGRQFTQYEIKDTLGWSKAETADEYIRLSAQMIKTTFKDKW